MPDLTNISISTLIIATVVTALVDQDRRGLFFFTEPEIFAVEEVEGTPEPTNFPVVWGAPLGEQTDSSLIRRRPDRARNVQRSRQTPQNIVSGFGSPIDSDNGVQSLETVKLAVAPNLTVSDTQFGDVVQAQPGSFSSVPISSPQTQAVTPSSLPLPSPVATSVRPINIPSGTFGQTGGPTIVITPAETELGVVEPIEPTEEIDDIDPVIPAVPEPASWLMMILGVGALGLMLRYRRDEFDAKLQKV